MGSVYRAWDCALERPAAIKLLHASIGWSENSDLQREAYALSRLQHPNIATFFEAGEVRGQLSGRRRPRRRRFGQGSNLRERTTASRARAAWSSAAISH